MAILRSVNYHGVLSAECGTESQAADSPAIHAADVTPPPSLDLARTIRPQGPANDLGAHKFVN